MSKCYLHNWEDSWIDCPTCVRELEAKNRHHEIIKIQRENLQAAQAWEFNESVRHQEVLEAQSQQNFEIKFQIEKLIEQEKQRVQIELERDVSPIDAFEKGNTFDPNEYYRISPHGELIVRRVNPYLRLPLKEAYEKGVIEYRNRNFPSDPGREYVLYKAMELGINFKEMKDWNITLVVNKNVEFTYFIMPGCDGKLPNGYEYFEASGPRSRVVMRLSDGELIPDSFTKFFDDPEVGKAYFEGVAQSLQRLNTPELKLQRLQLRQGKIERAAINERKYQEEIKEANAAREKKLKESSNSQKRKDLYKFLFIFSFVVIGPVYAAITTGNWVIGFLSFMGAVIVLAIMTG